MRLLHTSDWHLGQSLHNFERTYEHQCFLDWLLDTIVAEQADALLISGDVFDNANPSSASQRQLYRFLQQARARLHLAGRHLAVDVAQVRQRQHHARLQVDQALLEFLDGRDVTAQDGAVGVPCGHFAIHPFQ
eukprot:gene47122-58801_t